MNSTTLFIIRHGQTDWNLAEKLQGHTDIPLNAQGIEQAQKVAQFLKKKQISLASLYSSDLQRAHQTAHEISKIFTVDIILSADLREGHFGKAQGLTKKEYHDLYGPFDYQVLPEEIEAEPRHQVIARVKKFLTLIAQKHKGQQIAVVTHGGAIRSLISHFGHNIEDLPAITNVSVITLTWHADQEDIFILESIEKPL